MRIVAGSLRGRQFDSPGTSKTHPMSDKMRGALFNILGDIEGLVVLDAFAGSGALGFEAVSRGAAQAVLLEQDKPAQKVIMENIKTLGLETQVKAIKASGGGWLQTNQDSMFDIVLCDPPYRDLQISLIQRLAARTVPEGIVVVSLPADIDSLELPGCDLLDRRNYGDGSLAFYRKTL